LKQWLVQGETIANMMQKGAGANVIQLIHVPVEALFQLQQRAVLLNPLEKCLRLLLQGVIPGRRKNPGHGLWLAEVEGLGNPWIIGLVYGEFELGRAACRERD